MSGRRRGLDVVARLRRIRERQAQQDLARTQRRLADAQEKLREIRAGGPSVDVGVSLTPGQLLSLHLQGVRTAEDLEIAREEMVHCQAEIDRARAALASAASRRKAVDKLQEKRRILNAAEAARAAQMSMDELVLARHGRDDRPGQS